MPAFYDPARRQYLPGNWTILYELRECTPAELDHAIKQGALNPNCHRDDIIAWATQNCAARKQREARRKPKANKPTDDDQEHDEQLEKLRSVFRQSEIAAIFDTCPLAFRQKFARGLVNGEV